jgi:crossover junction endodeoxyribonuclease RusA
LTTRIELPVPPSVNNLFINCERGRFISPNYACWKSDAGWSLVQQKPQKFMTPVAVCMTIVGGKNFPIIRDLDNCWKAVLDLLKQHCIIPGDSVVWVRRLESEYIPPTKKGDPARCYVTITAIEGE